MKGTILYCTSYNTALHRTVPIAAAMYGSSYEYPYSPSRPAPSILVCTPSFLHKYTNMKVIPLFCKVWFVFICFVLFCFVLFCFLFVCGLMCFILFYVLFCLVLLLSFCFVQLCLLVFLLLFTVDRSPPTRLTLTQLPLAGNHHKGRHPGHALDGGASGSPLPSPVCSPLTSLPVSL